MPVPFGDWPVSEVPEISKCEGVRVTHPILLEMQVVHVAVGPEWSKACLRSHSRVSIPGLRVREG